jgi:hypothetical protein
MTPDTLDLETDLGSIASEFPRVIRRDLVQSRLHKPRVVPWLGHKIEKAVDAACAAIDHEPIGKQIQAELEFRMKKERPLFIHIEQLQDLVQEMLLELNFGRVAVAYATYRGHRAGLREQEAKFAEGGAVEQLELASPALSHDLRERLSFARIGLNLTLGEDELIVRLLRSVSLSLSPQEQRETIILNAKNLLDVDADCRFLAGRILLTYIYEETLPWKITDGINQLKEAHRKAFLKYIPLGIEIGRLDPRLAEFKLKELADAIDPYADLAIRFHRHPESLRPLSHSHEGPDPSAGPAPDRIAANFLDARGHGPGHARTGTGSAQQGILRHLPEQARLLVHADAFQLRDAPAAALELLPALLRRLDRGDRRDLDPLFARFEMGGRPRLLVDGGARQRRPHPRHQRRIEPASFRS